MPVNDLGYRKWDGEITSPYSRWLTIAKAGIKIVYKSQWIKRIMFFAWAPALMVGIFFFFYEQYVENRSMDPQAMNNSIDGFEAVRGILSMFSTSRREVEFVIESFSRQPDEARGYVWSFILLQLLKRSQGFMVLLLIGLIAPPLISKDIRSRAFLFYFSKPISRTDYLIGKFAVVGFFVGFVTVLPTLALYLFGVVLSPSFSVIASTWHLPFQVVAACLIGIVPACLIGMTLSSLTSESRFAGFAWFMIWILGYVGYQIVVNLQRTFPIDGKPVEEIESFWRLLSLYDCLSYLQGWIMLPTDKNQGYAISLFLFVIAICISCVFIILRKISAPLKA